MSVLKNKRALSELEFFHNATELRREITLLLLRDFGVKDKVRTVKSLYGISNMEPEDTKKIQEMVEKYGMCGSIVEEYPMWLIDKMRNNVLNICHSMIMNITQANTIYPMSEEEFHDRRNFQNHAIEMCIRDSLSSSHSLFSSSKYFPRNTLEMTRMGRKKFSPLSLHWLLEASPPPSRTV